MSDFLEKKMVQVVFDTASTDSAGVANTTVAAHPSGVFIPDNAIITNAFYEVNTLFTTAGADAGTIGIGVENAAAGTEDLVVAIAVSDAGNVWDAGIHSTLAGNYAMPDGTHETAIEDAALKVASYVKTTGNEEVTFNVAVQALTAGKLTLYIEYVVGL